jgi:hypothetical protein
MIAGFCVPLLYRFLKSTKAKQGVEIGGKWQGHHPNTCDSVGFVAALVRIPLRLRSTIWSPFSIIWRHVERVIVWSKMSPLSNWRTQWIRSENLVAYGHRFLGTLSLYTVIFIVREQRAIRASHVSMIQHVASPGSDCLSSPHPYVLRIM